MSWSLGEIGALSVKAARGAGFDWGLAEEAGYAVRWLQRAGAPGAQALANYLQYRDRRSATDRGDIDDGDIDIKSIADAGASAPNAIACPLRLGAALSDLGHVAEAKYDLRQPLLLAPFVAAAVAGGSRRLRWSGVDMLVFEDGLSPVLARRALLVGRAECRILHQDRADTAPVAASRTRVDDGESAAVAVLSRFAARTYAPASERSRRTGAGAADDN